MDITYDVTSSVLHTYPESFYFFIEMDHMGTKLDDLLFSILPLEAALETHLMPDSPHSNVLVTIEILLSVIFKTRLSLFL